jgi:Salmonella virulence plasmid 65kDa B protein
VAATGSYQTSVPISLPSFRGLEPTLALTYDSNAGNGVVGLGWSLSGLSTIQGASPGKGVPAYGGEDVFLLEGNELIECTEDHLKSPSCRYPAPDASAAYTTRIESFRRIAFDRGDSEEDGGRWYVWEKDGTKLTYGVGVTTDRGVYNWVLKRIEDTLGNTVTYDYWLDPWKRGDLPRLDLLQPDGRHLLPRAETRFDSIRQRELAVADLVGRRPGVPVASAPSRGGSRSGRPTCLRSGAPSPPSHVRARKRGARESLRTGRNSAPTH